MTRLAVAGVQARMSSTRLPGKVMMDINGQPMIQHVVDRLRRCMMIDHIVVLVPAVEGNNALTLYCRRNGIEVQQGGMDNVLKRYVKMSEDYPSEFIVRVTSDCPLIEPDMIDRMVRELNQEDADLILMDGDVAGTLGGQSAMSNYALKVAHEMTMDRPLDLEHVASFFFVEEAHRFRHVKIKPKPIYSKVPGLRLCVDEKQDLELVRRVFEHFGNGDFKTADAIKWLDKRPEVRRLNLEVEDSEANRALRRMKQA